MPDTKLQNPVDFTGQKFYIGLDVHKRSWAVTIRSMGLKIGHFTQQPSAEALAAHLKRKYPGGTYYSAYETGFCGTSIHEQLQKHGITNIVVHAADIPSTDKQRKNKTDIHDSRSIAEHLEKNNLRGIYVLSREQQELRSLFRLRSKKVIDVTRANNRLKGFLVYFGIEIPHHLAKKEYISRKVIAWLSNLELSSEAGTIALQQHLEALQYQRKQLFQITQLLRHHTQVVHGESYAYLISIPGIGAITAMGLLAEIADFKRFSDPDQYCSYLGLAPWENSSGEVQKTNGLQPRCNKHLRPLLIEASWKAIRTTPALFAYYSKHAVKDSKHAIVKVARKLALIAKAVVLNQQKYEAGRGQQKQKSTTNNAENEKVFLA